MNTIRAQFNEQDRAPIYDRSYENSLAVYMGDLDKQYKDALGRAKVNAARGGQGGGSLNVQNRRDIKDAYAKAVVKAQQMAKRIREQLFSQDQQSKGSLIEMAHGGLGATDAVSMALANMSANESNILASARNEGLGDVFADVGGIADARNVGVGRTKARDEYSSYYDNVGGNNYAGAIS